MPVSSPSAEASAGRLTHLDGLRGIAAFAVVIDHMAAFIPGFVYDVPAQSPAADLALRIVHFPVRAGSFAVFIFFVLSGFVISKSAAGAEENLALRVVRRYLRLTIPMTASTVLAWLLLEQFPDGARRAGAALHSVWVASHYTGPIPTFGGAAADGLWGTYMSGSSYLDPVLWSMRVELWGSLALYVIYTVAPQRYRVLALSIAAVLLLAAAKSVYLGFPLGALLYELWRQGRMRAHPRLGAAAIVLGMLLGPFGQSNIFAPETEWFMVHMGGRWAPLGPVFTLAATLIVGGVIVTPWAGRGLRRRTTGFLGRISYGLYLVHLPILMTAFATFYVTAGVLDSIPRAALWSAAFVTTVLVAAWLLTVVVDEPAVRLLKKIRPAKLRPVRPSAANSVPLA